MSRINICIILKIIIISSSSSSISGGLNSKFME